MKEKAVYLVLENGKVFNGYSFGASAQTVGEIAVTTSMVGYVETLTDPAYCGQIVVQTFPSIGNYGVIAADMESDVPALNAYIVREWCQEPSNFRCEGDLDTFLKDHGIVGVYGIDTRALTRLVREEGAMNAKITDQIDDLDSILQELKSYRIENAVEKVSVKETKVYPAQGESIAKIAAIDCGVKAEHIHAFTKRGCDVVLLPFNTTAQDVEKLGVDGVFLTGGPGNPADNTDLVQEVRTLIDKNVPIFGIGLGHQILALAHGAQTEKMHYGHRGSSQPSAQVGTARIHNTSQNCGYTIVEKSLPSNATVIYRNINDNVCEGVAYADEKAFSVQFYPSRDTETVYDNFIKMMVGGDQVCR